MNTILPASNHAAEMTEGHSHNQRSVYALRLDEFFLVLFEIIVVQIELSLNAPYDTRPWLRKRWVVRSWCITTGDHSFCRSTTLHVARGDQQLLRPGILPHVCYTDGARIRAVRARFFSRGAAL
jgi:hypothetical protein